MQYSEVAQVDPDDDSLMRYVVWHYRFDEARRERRNVTVTAYDNEWEFSVELARLNAELKRRQASGDAELVENISGIAKPPGSAADHRRRRAARIPRGPRARVRKRRNNP